MTLNIDPLPVKLPVKQMNQPYSDANMCVSTGEVLKIKVTASKQKQCTGTFFMYF